MIKTLIKIIIIVVIAILVAGFTEGLKSIEEKDKEIQEHKERIENLTIELKENKNREKETKQEVEYLNKNNKKLLENIEELEFQIKELKDIKIIDMEATAYSDDVISQGIWVGQTASGMKPKEGIVAVDPSVIPLGTELYVEGYGDALAGDTGGAIKGNRIDLFMNSRGQALAYGRKNIKVRIKE